MASVIFSNSDKHLFLFTARNKINFFNFIVRKGLISSYTDNMVTRFKELSYK